MSCATVWVIDSAALIELKRAIPGHSQWEFFQDLQQLVLAGRVVFPRQVVREMKETQHPDMPGAWIQGVYKHVDFNLNVDYDYVETVMNGTGDPLIDIEAENNPDPADPYVIGMAMELRDQGVEAVVATEDWKDHLPRNISVITACERLGVACGRLEDFLEWFEGHR